MRLLLLSALILPLCAASLAAQRPVASHAPSTPAPATAAVPTVAHVNGVAIVSDRLSAALSSLIPQESFHRNVSPEKMATLRAQALASLIDEELEYQDGVRRKIRATDADIRTAWTGMARQYGGEAKFRAALAGAHVTEANVRQELVRQIVIKKSVDTAVTNRCAVTVDDAAAFFRSNPERFVQPEQVHVFGITVGVDPSSNATVWQAAKAKAEEAHRALAEGRAFADVAAQYSSDPSRTDGGDMGLVHRGSMSAPFEEIVKGLKVGETSEVIESLYGYHVLRITDVRPPEQKTFDQVSATLVKDLTSRRCTEQKTAWLAGLHAAATIDQTEPTK